MFFIVYIIDTVIYNNIKISIVNRHYDYSEILKEANKIKNDQNKVIVSKVIEGIKTLQKQQKYVDKLNDKKFSLLEGQTFIINYSSYHNLIDLYETYTKYEAHNDMIAEDLKYVVLNSIANEGFYRYCNISSKNSILFPHPTLLCSYPMQLYYEIQSRDGLRILGNVLNTFK